MINRILSPVASIINLFIFFILFSNSIAEENNSKYYSNESGVLSLMYHRFNENKYPSTNIKMDIFEKHIQVIKDKNYQFENPEEFKKKFNFPKEEKKILITIDDAFLSFYENAWPFLKKNKIPFILFVSTEPVGKKGYMTWDQIKEVEKEKFAYIGNHSHSHEYLINLSFSEFKNDINKSINIFKSQLGYNPVFYSHPFGEYSQKQIKFLRENFEFAFGQHSGVIDVNKDKYQLPRFPINEKYGDLDRFKFLIDLSPLQFKKINPVDMYLIENNPPNLIVEFFEDQKNIRSINCFSDEGNKWEKSNVVFKNQKLQIIFRDKFLFRRGRVNCSLNDDGWRWFGIQFTVKTD
tara:strand:+ start:337 stop:1386 length:1050 start_codon:yes stop_codon:yes gene_type:complete